METQYNGAVSAGHQATAQTAAKILKSGGNAFDAVVAAHITACVAEPVLASFAGGGFLLAETASGQQTLYDFFVQTPVQLKEKENLSFFPITADFGFAKQEFHIGPGSVATPGTIKGLFEIHRDLCSMPFHRLAEQAISLARNGLKMNAFQANAIAITKPIYLSNREATAIFGSNSSGSLIQEGEILKQPQLADFIEKIALKGEKFFYEEEIAEKINRICDQHGGHLTHEDLEHYAVEKRDPLKITYRETQLNINPPPSSGGLLIAFALKLMETMPEDDYDSIAQLLVDVQEMTNIARVEQLIEQEKPGQHLDLLNDPHINIYKDQIMNRRKTSKGTTQISVIDSNGNMASLTTSNGAGSGVMIPGTGVMLNNMLGEEDLNPAGFYEWPENHRISSMMAPAILRFNDGEKVVLGSGGSNRIRTAILQVILNLTDQKMNIMDAIKAPRIHFENDFLNIEEGITPNVVKLLTSNYSNYKIWEKGNLFFGGVHAVSEKNGSFTGYGDPRRGGVSIIL